MQMGGKRFDLPFALLRLMIDDGLVTVDITETSGVLIEHLIRSVGLQSTEVDICTGQRGFHDEQE